MFFFSHAKNIAQTFSIYINFYQWQQIDVMQKFIKLFISSGCANIYGDERTTHEKANEAL